jgi:hypothetical protein
MIRYRKIGSGPRPAKATHYEGTLWVAGWGRGTVLPYRAVKR